MAIDHMRRTVGISVGPRAQLAKFRRSQAPQAQAQPRPQQQAESLTLRALSRKVDQLEGRVARRVNTAVAKHVGEAEAHILDKLHQKEQFDLQRIEAAKVGWSKFILRRCIESFVGVCMRNLPLIISMVLSIEIASGAAAGPLGLGISFGAIGGVALAVLLWQAYKAIKEYRAIKAAEASGRKETQDTNANAAHATAKAHDDAPAPATATDANDAPQTTPRRLAPHAAPAPQAPRPSWRQRSAAWRHSCADFAHFAVRRGIR